MGIVKAESFIKGSTRVGTPFYLAPEVEKRQPYSSPADIYSLGVVLLEIWFGQRSWQVVPSSLSDKRPLGDKVAELTWSQEGHDKIPGNCWRDWVRDCFKVPPGDRPTAEKLLAGVRDWETLLQNYRTVAVNTTS